MKQRKYSHRPLKSLSLVVELLLWAGVYSLLAIEPIGLKIKSTWEKRPITCLFLITLLILTIIILGTVIPSLQTFEGSLTLQSISFTSPSLQPLLNNVYPIAELSGVGEIPLRLTGNFNPPLPQNSKELQLQPQDPSAFWQIITPETSSLEITDLTLPIETEILNLSYDAVNQRLTFRISPTDSQNPAMLHLNPSGTLELQFNKYESSTGTSPESILWTPNTQITIPIQHPLDLDLKLGKFNPDLFWGRLKAKNVKLKDISLKDEDYEHLYKRSTILGGTVRLADKNYILEEGQFLSFQPADSIHTLLRLRLSNDSAPLIKTSDNKTLQISEPTQCLKVDISGKTRTILIGLNDQLAIAKLQSSLLEGVMSKEVFIAVSTFLTTLLLALTAKLLGL